MRQEYELTHKQLHFLMEACKPVPYILIGGIIPRSPHENAMAAWDTLGEQMGFVRDTVRPVPGKDDHFFTAEPKR